jgi:hypothetical protein
LLKCLSERVITSYKPRTHKYPNPCSRVVKKQPKNPARRKVPRKGGMGIRDMFLDAEMGRRGLMKKMAILCVRQNAVVDSDMR